MSRTLTEAALEGGAAVIPHMDKVLSFETFLITAEPVWVWDSDNKAIVWANAAARQLLGAADNAALRARRFKAGEAGIKQLSAIARRKNGSGQWAGRLHFSFMNGTGAIACEVQRLQLAGGARGAIVRVVEGNKRSQAQGKTVAKPARASQGVAVERPLPGKSKARSNSQPQTLRKSGTRRPVAGTASLAPVKMQKPITQKQQHAAASLAAGQRRAFRAKAADLDFLAGLSHDLRNPLTAVIGFAEILKTARQTPLSPAKVEEYAACISTSAVFALDLANSLMNYARFGRFEPVSEAAPLNVPELLAECVRLIAPIAAYTNLNLQLKTESGLPRLAMDERSLKQVLFNVLLNSIKYSAGGGVIKVRAYQNKAQQLVIAIEDNGNSAGDGPPAMPRALQIGSAAEVPSAGLGLAMVKLLLRQNMARLHRRKRTPVGTATKLIFPPARLHIQ